MQNFSSYYIMDPKIWGRDLWTSLIHIAKGYPESADATTQKNYLIFLTYLGFVLPCVVCQVNYKAHLRELPPDLRSSRTLLNWLHQIYNRTLIQQERKEVEFDEFMRKHSGSGNFGFFGSHKKISSGGVIFILMVLIFVVMYYFSNKKGAFPSLLGKQ